MVFYNTINTIRIFCYDSALIRYNLSAFYISSILTLYVNTFLYNASNNNNNNNVIINNIFILVMVWIKINSKLS